MRKKDLHDILIPLLTASGLHMDVIGEVCVEIIQNCNNCRDEVKIKLYQELAATIEFLTQKEMQTLTKEMQENKNV